MNPDLFLADYRARGITVIHLVLCQVNPTTRRILGTFESSITLLPFYIFLKVHFCDETDTAFKISFSLSFWVLFINNFNGSQDSIRFDILFFKCTITQSFLDDLASGFCLISFLSKNNSRFHNLSSKDVIYTQVTIKSTKASSKMKIKKTMHTLCSWLT